MNKIKIPHFEDGEDPAAWVEIYEDSADVYNWDDNAKLKSIPAYLDATRRSWYHNHRHEFTSWAEFKESFLDRYEQRKKIFGSKAKLSSIRRMENEPLKQYNDRFAKLRKLQLREAELREGSPLSEQELCQAYVEGIRPKVLRHFVKQSKPKTVAQAKKLARDFDDESDDEKDEETNEHESDEGLTKLTKEKVNPKKMQVSKSSSSSDSDVMVITKKLESLTLMVEQLHDVKKEKSCYNCQQKGHQASDCKEVCKLCKGRVGTQGHAYFKCPNYVPKRSEKTYLITEHKKIAGDDSVLLADDESEEPKIEENFAAAKRPRATRSTDDGQQKQDKRTRRKPFEDSPEKLIPILPEVVPEATESPQSRDVGVNCSNATAVMPGDTIRAADVRKAKVFLCSIEQFENSVKGYRTESKRLATKRQRKRAVNQMQDVFVMNDAEIPTGLGAPRVPVSVEGKFRTRAILDGGSTSNIMSLGLAKALGVTHLHKSKFTHGMADGRRVEAVGVAKNISITIQGVTHVVDVTVFERPDYDLLIGRKALHQFGIHTDWAKYNWSIPTTEGRVPLHVSYNGGSSNTSFQQSKSSSEEDYSDDSSDITSETEGTYLILPCETEDTMHVEEEALLDGKSMIKDSVSSKEEIRAELDKVFDSSTLSNEQKRELRELLERHLDVFGLGYRDLTQTNLVKLHIDTGNAKPIMKRPNQFMSHSELESLKKEIAEMLEQGLLIPAGHTPDKNGIRAGGWAFPALYVKKKNGEKRLCVQFQDLNGVTIRDPWPLPRIHDLLEDYGGARWFSTVDLLKGFNQIAVDEETIPKLTMAVPWGNFSFVVMPFGITNGPSTFARAIYLAMQEFLSQFVSTYIDDITIYSKSFEKHLEHLEKVLNRLRDVRMKINPKKCSFACGEVEVLGFIVSEQGIRPHPNKICKVQNFPRPKNRTDVRAFINLAGFYRRHIQSFSELVGPINELLSKNVQFTWDERREQSFQWVKEALVDAATLAYPDPSKPYKLFTDASEVGIGAVLTQFDEAADADRPICFLSRKLQAAETNYPTVEKELLAVVYALKKLRKYLLDKQFVLYTDNSAVRFLFCKTDPSQRLQRWIMAVQEFQFTVKHLPGKENIVADVLSRYPPKVMTHSDEEDVFENLYPGWLIEDIEKDKVYEEWLQEIWEYLSRMDHSVNRRIKERAKNYKLEEGRLYRLIGQRCVRVPYPVERTQILTEVHDGHGHYGQQATWARLYLNYWWPGVYDEVKQYVNSCHQCQIFSSIPRTPPASNQIKVQELFERFALDFVGPLPTSEKGNKYLIVGIEYYTNWPVAKAVPSANAASVVKFLYEDIFCNFGPPKEILTDNGSHFLNSGVKQFVDLVKVRHKFTAPYRPQTNGKVEKFNGTLVKGLRKLVNQERRNWDEFVSTVLYSYRTKSHGTLGISPFELLYGIAPHHPEQDILQQLGTKLGMERHVLLQDQRLRDQDQYQEEKPVALSQSPLFPVGSLVLRKNFQRKDKLSPMFKEKVYRVLAAFTNGTFVLADETGKRLKRRINGATLRAYHKRELARDRPWMAMGEC